MYFNSVTTYVIGVLERTAYPQKSETELEKSKLFKYKERYVPAAID